MTCRVFLIFILCFCLLVTGVFASSDFPTALAAYQPIDLLSDAGVFYINGSEYFSPILEGARSSYEFSWGYYGTDTVSRIDIMIAANAKPITVYWGDRLCTFSGTTDDGYIYECTWSGVPRDIELTVNFDSGSTDFCSLVYVKGFMSNTVPIDRCAVYIAYPNVEGYSIPNAPIPNSYGKADHGPFAANNPDNHSSVNKFRFRLPEGYRDYLVVDFYVSYDSSNNLGDWWVPLVNDYVGAQLLTNGSPADRLDCEVKYYWEPGYKLYYNSRFVMRVFVDTSCINFDAYETRDPQIELSFSTLGNVTKYDSSGVPVYLQFMLTCVGAVAGFYPTEINPNLGLSAWLSGKLDALFGALGGQIDPTVPDVVQNAQDNADAAIDAASQWEQGQYDQINTGAADTGQTVSSGIASFGNALAFVQVYATNIANGIDDYLIVFTLPIFVGIFLYVCSRAPGITRAFRDRRPDD